MDKSMIDDWELTPSAKAATTVVLLGKAGNGKSATGNSILGRQAFFSDFSLSGITSTCEFRSTYLRDGRMVNVIDTPGLFDFSAEPDLVGKEIVKCINLAKDGVHAVLMVFSITSRFTREEEAAIESMKSFFGEKIVDYMIIVFTGGDILEARGKSFKDYINEGPEPVQNILRSCKNRVMLFNNSTHDKMTQAKQVDQLLSLVDMVVASNDGKPFSDEIFNELKNEAEEEGHSEEQISELKEQLHKLHEEQMNQVTQTIEGKLNEAIKRLEKQLSEEQAARLNAEKEARKSSEKEISQKLHEEQLNQVTETIEGKLNEAIERLEKQLAEEQTARLIAEKCANRARQISDTEISKLKETSENEILKLKEQLKKAQEENRTFRFRFQRQPEPPSHPCFIL